MQVSLLSEKKRDAEELAQAEKAMKAAKVEADMLKVLASGDRLGANLNDQSSYGGGGVGYDRGGDGYDRPYTLWTPSEFYRGAL